MVTVEPHSEVFQADIKAFIAIDHIHKSIQKTTVQIPETTTWLSVGQFIYLTITVILIFKTICGVVKIAKLYFQYPRTKEGNITYILFTKEQTIFSFFSWLFYYPSLKNNEAILAHELVHIKERHSLDLLFFDIVIALNWFNPIVYLLFKSVKINHEYIADRNAAKEMVSKFEYAKLLINHVGISDYRLGLSLSNGSQLQQRLYQLSHKQSKKYVLFQSIVILPFLAGLVILFSAFTSSNSYKILTYNSFNFTNNQKIVSKINHYQKSKADPPEKNMVSLTVPERVKIKENQAILVKENKLKKRINALEVMYDWAMNTTGNEIRSIKHSVFMGKEAQLFRGHSSDTLYVDNGDFKISGNEIELLVDQLMINSQPLNQKEKELVVIDAKKEKLITALPQFIIKTKGMIHELRMVDLEGKQTERNLLAYNRRVQYAFVSATQILVEKEDESAPYQPAILW